MGFALTLIYVAITLLSPSVLPDAIVSLHVNDILGVLLILSLLPSIPSAKLGSTPETYLAIGLLIATTFSILVTGWMGGAADTFLGFLPILLSFFFIAISCRSLLRLKILTGVLVGVGLFIFSQGALAYFTGNFASRYLEPEVITGATLYRFCGRGVISDPNDLAQVFVALIPLLWLRWKPKHFAGNFLFTIVPAGVLAVGVYFTHSRGGAIALIAVVLWGFKDKLSLVGSAIFAAISFAGLMALNISGGRGMDEDDGGRIAAWVTGLQVFKAHPLFGIGVNNFGNYNETGATAHNSYILGLAELGIFGYFFWMGMIVAGWNGLSRMIPPRRKKARFIDSEVPDGSNLSKNELADFTEPWLGTAEVNRVAVPAGPGSTMLSRSTLYASELSDAGTRSPYPLGEIEEDGATNALSENDSLIRAAKVFQVSFVGLLTSAFFISRTYSVMLYVLLGMAAALKSIYREKHPEMTADVANLMKRTWIVIFASIILLYLFVRLHGVR